MKKAFLALAALLMVCLLLSGCSNGWENDQRKKDQAAEVTPIPTAEPEQHTSGDYRYIILKDGTAEIIGYSGKEEDLIIPDTLDGISVTSIGDYAFYKCSYLTSVTIPDSVTSIGGWAFSSCMSLPSVTIPDSVTSIGMNPFEWCGQLTEIQVSQAHPTLATIDGVLFSKPDKRLVCYPCAFTAESYTIPDGIQIIGDGAFFLCSPLTSVTIPDSVTSIGDRAFASCSSLMSVTIPDSVTSIGDRAFSECSSLTSITITDSVSSIGNKAFSDCSSELTVTVSRDSYAAQYCKDNDINYTYPDANDWLNN